MYKHTCHGVELCSLRAPDRFVGGPGVQKWLGEVTPPPTLSITAIFVSCDQTDLTTRGLPSLTPTPPGLTSHPAVTWPQTGHLREPYVADPDMTWPLNDRQQ